MKTNEQSHSVAYYHAYRYSLHSASISRRNFKMNGARRVVIFCLLTAVLPTILIIIPLYLRHNVFSDIVYDVAESDVLEIGDDISTIFCQDHTVKMNTSFNAYQVENKPEISNSRKHIRLKKSMRLPDDTLEYWGFFLPKGSTVRLSVCSRYDGSRILVVKGEKNLRTCGLLDHSKRKETQVTTQSSPGQFRVRFEINVDNYATNSFAPNATTPIPSLDITHSFELNETTHIPSVDIPNENATRKSRSVDIDLANNAAEDEQEDGLQTFLAVSRLAREIIDKRSGVLSKPRTYEESILGRKLRHSRGRNFRSRRNAPHNLDGKVVHGGNAANHIPVDSEESSASSFEKELFTCYGGDILLTQGFPSSYLCSNVSYLLANYTGRMTTTHNVNEDGYYYYIFYSDNDLVENVIHAVFDIYKPSYQLANITKSCINKTSCSFPVSMFSKEIVIVEIPTRDGIENEEEDMAQLVSVCHPRMAVYVIFPLLVLILILGCAFL